MTDLIAERQATLLAFHDACHAKDLSELVGMLHPDVIAFGPDGRHRSGDRQSVITMLGRVFGTYDRLLLEPAIGSLDRAVVPFAAELGANRVRGAYLLRVDEAGAITELELVVDSSTRKRLAQDGA